MQRTLKELLNPQQYQACTFSQNPLLIVAGAGSGKTRVITHRIVYLMQHFKMWGEQILAVTFTNKAATEMRERVVGLIERFQLQRKGSPRISTFHSTCAFILRRHGKHIGLTSGFSIYDSADTRSALKRCSVRMGLKLELSELKEIQGSIEGFKRKVLRPKDAMSAAVRPRECLHAEFYQAYEKELKASNAVDFNDLILKVHQLFDENPEVLSHYQHRWRHIFVDEFQDTDPAQYNLLKKLSASHQQITMVGDDDQSIYGWRGADITHMLSFEKDFPNAEVITLEQNYRSTQAILSITARLIEHNKGRRAKRLWTQRLGGKPVTCYTARDERDEARFISKNVGMERRRRDLKEIAVLFRTHAQSRVIEEQMRAAGIPYKLIGGTAFYARAEVKDVLAYLQLIANPRNNAAFGRILNVPTRGIGARTRTAFEKFAEEHTEGDLSRALENCSKVSSVSARARNQLGKFGAQLTKWRALAATQPPTQVLLIILEEIRYLDHLLKRDRDRAEQTIDNVRELQVAIAEYEEGCDEPSLTGFLEEASLSGGIESTSDEDALQMMSIHGSKGLEFDVVFSVGLEEDLLPYRRAGHSDIEEERRLAYVAFTRARDLLILSHAVQRRLYNRTEYPQPSRFLQEAGLHEMLQQRSPHLAPAPALTTHSQRTQENHLFRPDPAPQRSLSRVGNRRSELSSSPKSSQSKTLSGRSSGSRDKSFQAGDVVIHPKFGIGEVQNVTQGGKGDVLLVDFASVGKKKILSRFVEKL